MLTEARQSLQPAGRGDFSDELRALTHEELVACARLLAASVAHHRIKFGVIPVSSSYQQLEAGTNQQLPAAVEFRALARSSFAEALESVRMSAAVVNPVVAEAGDVESVDAPRADKRRQLRIRVQAPAKVAALDADAPVAAILHDISWGGASIRCPEMPGAIGERIRLFLPVGASKMIAIVAVILRATPVEGQIEYGLRFDSLSPADEDRLQKVLEILVAKPENTGHRRSEVRLAQRLEIEYGDSGEFRATLEDISASGLMLTVPEPLEIDQSLLITLSSADTTHSINLRARVVHQTLVAESGLEMYRVGLQIQHPDAELRERVGALLQQLAVMRPHESELAQLEAM